MSSEKITHSHTAVHTWQLLWHAQKLLNSLHAPHVRRCRQPHCPFSRGLLEFLSGAISDPFPNPPKECRGAGFSPLPLTFKMPIMAIEPTPTLRLYSFPMSASSLHAASPSDAPSTKSDELGLRARQSKRRLRRAPRSDEITSSHD